MSFFAYKGFDKDLTCRGFQYEIGKTYSIPEKPKICERGFHCCVRLLDVFSYYRPYIWDTEGCCDDPFPERKVPSGNRYCIVEVCGDIDTDPAGFAISSKVATNSIKILKELTDDNIIDTLEMEASETHSTWRRIEEVVDDFKANVQKEELISYGIRQPDFSNRIH